MQNILNKTERTLRLLNYSSQTRKTYLLYIKEYIIFSKRKNIKDDILPALKSGVSRPSEDDISVLIHPRNKQSLLLRSKLRGVLEICYKSFLKKKAGEDSHLQLLG